MAWWQLVGLFLIQLMLILLAAQLFGRLARYVGQPKVVGEMIAGVTLGPSLLGWWLPELQQAIFIPETRSWLYFGAQLGVGLYMFLVGLEFNTRLFRQQAQSALTVSLAGMLVPFAVAALLALWLLPMPGLFAPGISYANAALFLGAAIAITAFPMLARIIYERGLAGTKLGTLALAAGAIDDAAAWLVLALVLASFGGGSELLIKALLGGSLYAWLMLTKMRLWLQPLADRVALTEQLAAWQFVLILLLFALSAWSMDFVGLHAVFGGFLLGVAMPRGTLVSVLQRRLEKPVLLLLLPMFFTYSGLNTRLDVLGAGGLWLVTLVVLACSILAKFVACWAAARLKGADNPTALAIGALMNARGLMELIIINIALSYGVIEQGLFSMLVVMAIVTTLMAAPLFQLVYGRFQTKAIQNKPDQAKV
ncbi:MULTISPECIES: cation:proton antiporter [unclassified Alishewanella]|uniref:cation:proton antiporter n=1 Tax=unclassified Alishewanella TaxID=2628974 RepID=UPI0008236768|nr:MULTISPECIES: cation:proton antiporter [unclassified Alishewanella]MCT8127483.1 cation:proton antiporter [Alishewanella sp. BS5-314]OCW96178.1 potassium transporter [Alishewanella sp. HH-ZS]